MIRDHDGTIVREVSITPIPVDRPPFPLARNVDVPVYFTIQPGAAYVYATSAYGGRMGAAARTLPQATTNAGGYDRGGAWLVYPNFRQGFPGKRVQFFHYDAGSRFTTTSRRIRCRVRLQAACSKGLTRTASARVDRTAAAN